MLTMPQKYTMLNLGLLKKSEEPILALALSYIQVHQNPLMFTRSKLIRHLESFTTSLFRVGLILRLICDTTICSVVFRVTDVCLGTACERQIRKINKKY